MKKKESTKQTISGSKQAVMLLKEIRALTGMLHYRILEAALEQFLNSKREEQKS